MAFARVYKPIYIYTREAKKGDVPGAKSIKRNTYIYSSIVLSSLRRSSFISRLASYPDNIFILSLLRSVQAHHITALALSQFSTPAVIRLCRWCRRSANIMTARKEEDEKKKNVVVVVNYDREILFLSSLAIDFSLRGDMNRIKSEWAIPAKASACICI